MERRLSDLIRVLIADDHAIVREPLRAWLDEEPGLEVVGEAATGDETIRLTQKLQPGVLLLDVCLPDADDGVEVARVLRHTTPVTRIIALTGLGPERAPTLLRLGVRRYLPKTMALSDLVGTIRLLMTGRSTPPRPSATTSTYPEPRPTPRQLDVLRLIVAGLGNRAIAERLGICERTVECHITALLAKFAAGSRAGLVRIALQQGWVT